MKRSGKHDLLLDTHEPETMKSPVSNIGSRSSFANSWVPGRLRKIAPIELAFRRNGAMRSDMVRLLDIGAGAGLIGYGVATRLGLDCVQVDAEDQRVSQGPPFCFALGECLPFGDETFDLVVANHVIEHVGDQSAFVAEIARVLRPGGYCYVATPNKYSPVEPHYKLPFLSWVPKGVADAAVRLAKKGKSYDVQPLTREELRLLGTRANLLAEELTEEMIKQPRLYGRSSRGALLGSLLPSLALKAALAIVPTHVWLLHKPLLPERTR
jgi:2-polyprenyl-3-methyl-5-hydroxy-6-metoxy-1,4-benzoquinol methylase